MSSDPEQSGAAIDRLLAHVRSRLHRVDAEQAAAAIAHGALLIDIRPAAQRATSGEIPSAIVIERNQLEWRLDPTSAHHIPEVHDHDHTIIIVCDEGYASSLAAATLQDLGLHNATDLVGGFRAWSAAGLPVAR